MGCDLIPSNTLGWPSISKFRVSMTWLNVNGSSSLNGNGVVFCPITSGQQTPSTNDWVMKQFDLNAQILHYAPYAH